VAREVADSGALFVWALARTEDGAVWVGTGLPGRLLRVGEGGEIDPVFESGDDPVRCITALGDGAVVFGTGGRGRVVRVESGGRPFVLFDAEEAEIVALAAAADGTVYALTARGSKQIAAARTAASATPDATVRVTASAPAPEREGEEEDDSGETSEAEAARRAAPRRFKTPPGGALYRIAPGGDFRRLWEAKNEVPFGLVLREDGTLLVSTGDRGRIHAIDPEGRSSMLVRVPSDQASALSLDGERGVLVGGTTDARVERLGAGLRSGGSWISAAHDAGAVADWGRVRWESDLPRGGEVRAALRAGNTAEPDATWTDWVSHEDAAARLPATRWLQVRLDLRPSRAGASPGVRLLESFYRAHNRRPTIDEVSVQDPGVVWMHATPTSARPVGPTVALDPVARRTVEALRTAKVQRPVRKLYERGARTVSWNASDPDGDRLTFHIDVRREGASDWIPLAADLEGDYHSWDERALADGLYRVRLTASDARDNESGTSLEDSRTSAAFRVDHTRPIVGPPEIRRNGDRVEVEFTASDRGGSVVSAEIALDAAEWTPLEPLDGVADEPEERFRVTLDATPTGEAGSPGTLRVRVTDAAGNLSGDAWSL
jgi:hypothetical protein